MRSFQNDLEERKEFTHVHGYKSKCHRKETWPAKFHSCFCQFFKHLKEEYTDQIRLANVEIQTDSFWCEFLEIRIYLHAVINIIHQIPVSSLEKFKGRICKNKYLILKPNLFELAGTASMRIQSSFSQLINHILSLKIHLIFIILVD